MHLEKAYLLILVTNNGIFICSNDEHLIKAEYPIFVTSGGISIFVSDEQP